MKQKRGQAGGAPKKELLRFTFRVSAKGDGLYFRFLYRKLWEDDVRASLVTIGSKASIETQQLVRGGSIPRSLLHG